jgi:hypothetical protein
LIKPSRTVIGLGAASLVAIGYGALARRRRGRATAASALGLGGLGYAAYAWRAEDTADQEITRNPEVMNGHFLTAGGASAVYGDLADVEYLRGLMGVPNEPAARPRRGRIAVGGRMDPYLTRPMNYLERLKAGLL